ncbi:MAG: hypothetical protein AAGA73_24270, partial [Pseudomonadota bacterium]
SPDRMITISAQAEEAAPLSAMSTRATQRGATITRHWITSFRLFHPECDHAGKLALLARGQMD